MAQIKDPVLRGFYIALAAASVLSAIGGLLASLGLLGFTGYTWLRYGYWDWFNGYDGLLQLHWAPPFVENWAGVNKIIHWLLDIPLAVTSAPAGMLLGWFLALLAQDAERDALQRQADLERERRNRAHAID